MTSLTLPESLYSPDQLQFCSEELHALATGILTEKRGGGQRHELTLSQQTLDLIASLPRQKHADPTYLDEVARDLAAMVTQAPVVHITLAAAPGPTLKHELVRWFRDACGSQVLVAFRVTPDIAGGMIVRTTNRIHDFSFRNLLTAEPAKFVEAVERVR